jgi:hypothetical protein
MRPNRRRDQENYCLSSAYQILILWVIQGVTTLRDGLNKCTNSIGNFFTEVGLGIEYQSQAILPQFEGLGVGYIDCKLDSL